MTDVHSQNWFTLPEAAQYTRKTPDILRRAVRDDRVEYRRHGRGGKLYFAREWLNAYMADPTRTVAERQAMSA